LKEESPVLNVDETGLDSLLFRIGLGDSFVAQGTKTTVLWKHCVRGGGFRGSLSGVWVCLVSLVCRTK